MVEPPGVVNLIENLCCVAIGFRIGGVLFKALDDRKSIFTLTKQYFARVEIQQHRKRHA